MNEPKLGPMKLSTRGAGGVTVELEPQRERERERVRERWRQQ